MAQAGLVEIMDEMADQIRATLVTVTDVDVQVEPRMIPNPSPPTIDIYPGDTPRDRESAAYSILDDEGYFITVRARVGTADNFAGQDLLLAFVDPTDPLSIGQALYDEPTLNGLASDLDIVAQTGYIAIPDLDGAATRLGCQWTVRVLPVTS
jgi:hypothetical protein